MENIHSWMIDQESSTAQHESGLLVQFQVAELGLIDGFPVNKDVWIASFPPSEHNMVLSLFPALMRQCAEAYCQSLSQRN